MSALREKLFEPDAFLIGVELVSTRGTMAEIKARHIRAFAAALGACAKIDWVSITDNAGGNPMLGPMTLGKPILYGGKEVMIHLSCKDFNRNGLEQEAWQLASEGFHNILALSGDAPARGYKGAAKSVFDIDSVGLLTLLRAMNQGLETQRRAKSRPSKLKETAFFLGTVTTNFKRFENEVVPQYLKLDKKIKCGAEFVIAQIGYDTRKSSELKAYLQRGGNGSIPLVGNVYLLNERVARFFNADRIPGVGVSEALLRECERQAQSPDKGRSWFFDLAAKQVAIFRGLGFAGAYLGGVESIEEVNEILGRADRFSRDDWKQFALEIQYDHPESFFLFEKDAETGLADAGRLNPEYERSLKERKSGRNVTVGYRMGRWMHDLLFEPDTPMFRMARRIYANAKDSEQGPGVLRIIEKVSKVALYDCRDCGDCSLPEIGLLCPESQCAKNQRNGPCGGTRNGKCEVEDVSCIWCRAYDRAKFEGKSLELLAHAPVIQDQTLRGTSSWANLFLGKDHQAHPVKSDAARGQESDSEQAGVEPVVAGAGAGAGEGEGEQPKEEASHERQAAPGP